MQCRYRSTLSGCHFQSSLDAQIFDVEQHLFRIGIDAKRSRPFQFFPAITAAQKKTSGEGFVLATSSPVTTGTPAGISSFFRSLAVCSSPPVVAIAQRI